MREKTQTDYIKTALRLPPELHAAVHEAAKASGRTFNAELIHLLAKALGSEEVAAPLGKDVAERLIEALQAYTAKLP